MFTMPEEVQPNEKPYTIDENGHYYHKFADSIKQFQDAALGAQKNGDTELAHHCEELERQLLNEYGVEVTNEDFDKLSTEGLLQLFTLRQRWAYLNKDETNLRVCKEALTTLRRELHLQDAENNQIETKPIDQRVHFDLSEDKARHLLASAMEVTDATGTLTVPNESTVYNSFSHELPDDMEHRAPSGFNEFGVEFFKKQMPNYDGSSSSLKELFQSDTYKAIKSPCITPQYENSSSLDDAMTFIHCYNPNIPGKNGGQGQTNCRFYLCPKPDNLVPIMDAFVQKSDAANLPYYFKFSTDPDRNDKLVIYSNDKNAEKHLAALKQIQNEHPEWFDGAGQNPLWGSIENAPGIYYGAEPQEAGKDSYGAKRADIFTEALVKWREEFGIQISASNYEELIKSKNISDQQVRRFITLFDEACKRAGTSLKTFASIR